MDHYVDIEATKQKGLKWEQYGKRAADIINKLNKELTMAGTEGLIGASANVINNAKNQVTPGMNKYAEKMASFGVGIKKAAQNAAQMDSEVASNFSVDSIGGTKAALGNTVSIPGRSDQVIDLVALRANASGATGGKRYDQVSENIDYDHVMENTTEKYFEEKQIDPNAVIEGATEKLSRNVPPKGQTTENNIYINSAEHDGNRIGSVDEGFVTIIEEHADGTIETHYGGNQHWIQNDPDMGMLANTYGCGVIAAINQSLYLTGRTTITKDEYMKLIDDYFAANDCNKYFRGIVSAERKAWIKGPLHDALPLNMLVYTNNICEGNGVKYFSWYGHFAGYEKDYQNMKKQLKNGVPVIWGQHDWDGEMVKYYTYNNGQYQFNPQAPNWASSHYVMATGIYEEIDDNGHARRMVEISSCGEKLYVDYDQYIEVVGDNIANQPFSSITNTTVN